MPRLRQVDRAEAMAGDGHGIVAAMYRLIFGDRDPVAEPGTATGTPGDWWTVWAGSPDILQHAVQGFGLYQSPDRQLDPVLRELGQARAGYSAGSRFVFSQHCKSLRGLGVSEERIGAVAHWPVADCFDEVERLVLAYTDCLVLQHGRVPDALFDALRRHLSDVELLELTYITTLYFQHAVMSRALRTELDDVDEPVVEVRVPGAEDTIVPLTPKER
ncbi:MAG TPA: carboxymuconolactone decarboxylase family protein [Acidimicrobiales bacterium]|nr:carboxymuconolactone decarboxylase family protein [Acidimicrobiales bacterium]